MSAFGVLLFHNSSSAMQAEAVLVRAGLKVKLIPTPRHLSSDCGVALRFDGSQNAEVTALLDRAHVDVAGNHRLDRR
jgi:hypothetical protein